MLFRKPEAHNVAPVVYNGQTVSIDLLGGPGYYVVRRLDVTRTAGAAAANAAPTLAEVTPPNVLRTPLVVPSGALPTVRWPSSTDDAPARYLYTDSGTVFLDYGCDVNGDTMAAFLVVERIR